MLLLLFLLFLLLLDQPQNVAIKDVYGCSMIESDVRYSTGRREVEKNLKDIEKSKKKIKYRINCKNRKKSEKIGKNGKNRKESGKISVDLQIRENQ